MTQKKTSHKSKAKAPAKARRRSRTQAPFPAVTIQDALVLAQAIQKHGGGQKVRRLTLFDELGRSPESSASRQMITHSNRYGLTKGGYQAEFLELTDKGQLATSPDSSPRARRKALFDLAIEGVAPFAHLYGTLIAKRIPSPQVLRDSLEEVGVADAHRKECVDVFLENAKHLGLLRSISGAERLIKIDQVLEELGTDLEVADPDAHDADTESTPPASAKRTKKAWAKTCFVISPIGDEGEEERKHADMILSSLIERALEEDDFEVVRADRISDPGMITGQVIEYILRSGLVVADLSFHNPNVFYELAIRHMTGLPTVHLIRKSDPIPFDLKDFRTVVLDTADKYELVSQLDTYRSEIANRVRIAHSSGGESNPIKTFAPGLVVTLPHQAGDSDGG